MTKKDILDFFNEQKIELFEQNEGFFYFIYQDNTFGLSFSQDIPDVFLIQYAQVVDGTYTQDEYIRAANQLCGTYRILKVRFNVNDEGQPFVMFAIDTFMDKDILETQFNDIMKTLLLSYGRYEDALKQHRARNAE